MAENQNQNRMTQFYVTKMKCDDCIKIATDSLQKISGLISVEFNLDEGTAVVQGDIDPQAVCMVLTEAGYPAAVKSK